MEESLAKRLVAESMDQIRMRRGLKQITIEPQDYEDILKAFTFPQESHMGLYRLDFDRKEYEHLRKEKLRTLFERERTEPLPVETNMICLRAVILNNQVKYESRPALSKAERAKRYAVVLNQRVYHRGFSTEMEYEDMIVKNPELVAFLQSLHERGEHYSLFFRWNQLDPTKSGSKHDIIRPILTCPGATEEEVRSQIIPYENKERKPTGFPDH